MVPKWINRIYLLSLIALAISLSLHARTAASSFSRTVDYIGNAAFLGAAVWVFIEFRRRMDALDDDDRLAQYEAATMTMYWIGFASNLFDVGWAAAHGRLDGVSTAALAFWIVLLIFINRGTGAGKRARRWYGEKSKALLAKIQIKKPATEASR